MHDVSARIAAWRRELARTGWLGADELDELEDHLHSAATEEQGAGYAPREAFERAVIRFGATAPVLDEYRKVLRPMNARSKIAGLAVTAAVLALGAGSGGTLFAFVHVPALVFVVGLVAGGLWASFGLGSVALAFRASFRGEPLVDPAERTLAHAVLQRAGHLAWAGGALGTIIGAIAMLASLEDPARIGPGLSLCLLSLLYGGVLAELVLRNMAQWLRDPAAAPIDRRAPTGR